MSIVTYALARLALVFLVLAMVGGCAERVNEVPVYMNVKTYLSTPMPNDVTLAHARRRCLGIGRNAVWRQTRSLGGRGYDHIYECV